MEVLQETSPISQQILKLYFPPSENLEPKNLAHHQSETSRSFEDNFLKEGYTLADLYCF